MLDIVTSLEELRHAGAEFLIADLGTAITFTDLALSSKDQTAIDRNRRNALRAYHAVTRLIPKCHLNESEWNAIAALLARLKAKLALLGEEVDDSSAGPG